MPAVASKLTPSSRPASATSPSRTCPGKVSVTCARRVTSSAAKNPDTPLMVWNTRKSALICSPCEGSCAHKRTSDYLRALTLEARVPFMRFGRYVLAPMLSASTPTSARDSTAPAESGALRSSLEILATQEPKRLLETIVEVSKRVMKADTVSLLLPGVDGSLYVAHSAGLAPEIQARTRITPGEGIAGRIALSRRPTIITGEARSVPDADPNNASRVRTSIVYPLVSDEQLLGIVTFNRLSLERPYEQRDLDRAGALADQIVLAVENCRLAQRNAVTDKLLAVGQLAAGMAHEFNSPMQFVMSGAYFLQDALKDLQALWALSQKLRDRALAAGFEPELARELVELERTLTAGSLFGDATRAVEHVLDGSERVAKLVATLREFGRPDGDLRVPTDLNEAVDTVLSIARPRYERVASISTELGELPPVVCNAAEMNQVFLSLLSNAAQAIERRGREEKRGTITIRSRVEQSAAVISVEDDGCGIPEAIRGRIFEPFFSTAEVGRGTGLGLHTVYSIVVERHAGSITFESEVGRGTRFELRLPL
jgi:signal transduction histidine kinase